MAAPVITKFSDLRDVPPWGGIDGVWAREAGVLVWHALSDFVRQADARLTDQRVPTDGSVTNVKVAANAAIAYSKLALASAIQVADLAFDPATQAELNSAVVVLDRFFEDTRTSDCQTIPILLASGTNTPTSGTMYGVYAKAKNGGTFSKIRFGTSSAFTALTDFRCGVYNADATGSKIAETGNLLSLITGGNIVITGNLLANLTLAAGQIVFITMAGLSQTGGSVKGLSGGVTPAMSLFTSAPIGMAISRFTTWAGGALPAALASTSGVSSLLPWIELVP